MRSRQLRYTDVPIKCAGSAAGESNGFLIQETVFVCVFTGFLRVVDGGISAISDSPRCGEFHGFAAKISQTVEATVKSETLRSRPVVELSQGLCLFATHSVADVIECAALKLFTN
jgi:hypothetical protein